MKGIVFNRSAGKIAFNSSNGKIAMSPNCTPCACMGAVKIKGFNFTMSGNIICPACKVYNDHRTPNVGTAGEAGITSARVNLSAFLPFDTPVDPCQIYRVIVRGAASGIYSGYNFCVFVSIDPSHSAVQVSAGHTASATDFSYSVDGTDPDTGTYLIFQGSTPTPSCTATQTIINQMSPMGTYPTGPCSNTMPPTQNPYDPLGYGGTVTITPVPA